jgi:hypothetical protein
VRRQLRPGDQLIIVNDGPQGSSGLDGTATVVLVESTGSGPSAARNRGAAVATGEWLMFLDDDDVPHADWLDALRSMFAVEASVVSAGVTFVSPDGTRSDVLPATAGPVFGDQVALLLAGSFGVRRSHFDAVGGFDAELRCLEFTELSLRLLPDATVAPGACRWIGRTVIDIQRRASDTRVAFEPSVHLAAGQRMLELHRDRWRRVPHELATQLSVLGVAAVRSRRPAVAVRLLAGAVRSEPRRPQHWIRLAVSLVPPLARSLWRVPSSGA